MLAYLIAVAWDSSSKSQNLTDLSAEPVTKPCCSKPLYECRHTAITLDYTDLIRGQGNAPECAIVGRHLVQQLPGCNLIQP